MSDEIRDLSGEPFKSHREHHAAKARLEAAAPSLLKALKEIDAMWSEDGHSPDSQRSQVHFTDRLIHSWKMMRAAIELAEGSADGPRTGQAVVYLLAILACLGIAGAYAYAVYQGWLK